MRLRLIRSVVFVLFMLAIQPGFGQTSKGTLAGTVQDSSGAAVASATVRVTNQDTGETRETKTSNQGAYRIEAIDPGHYSLHTETTGFSPQNIKDINVNPSSVTTYDVKLAVGDVNVVVEVQASGNEINTENGHLSGSVSTQEMQYVPVFSLNPYELIATLPGVQLVNPALNLGGTGGNYEQLSANGARPRSNNFLLDSQDINDVGIGGQSFNPQVPDMYQSETALLNSTSAEYGRSGGAVINLITRSGTNQFHGSLFELYSGSGLNALDGVTREGKPFPAGTPSPKARYDQHQYGFTAGGPIWKNKLFAFGGTQFTRFYGQSSTNSITLPDAAGYAELTALAGVSPTAKTQVALLQGLLNNGSYLNAYQFLAANGTKKLNVSAANCPNGVACSVEVGTFQRPPVSQQQPDTQWMYRVDFNPNQADTLSFRYLHDRQSYTPYLGLNSSGLPGFDAQEGGPTELGEGTWTRLLTPRLLNEFRVSEVRLNSQFAPRPETLANPLSKSFNVGLAGSGLPTLGISQNMPQGRLQELYQFQDTVGWTIGRQSLRMGADIARDHETDLVAQNALGSITYAAASSTTSSLDNFLSNQTGSGGSITKTFGPTRVDPHLWKMAGFVQDDIKFTPDFTLNVGLRYDYMTNPENALPYPGVDPSNLLAPINTVVPIKADKNNFGPRLGFAYVPHMGMFSDGKTVIHGGFGMFYDVSFTNILVNSAQSSPVAPTGLLNGTSTNPLPNATSLLGGLSANLTPLSAVLSVSSKQVNPYVYQYNMGFERVLPGRIKLTANYVGSNGKKLFASQQYNPFFNGARLNTTRGAITLRNNGGDSNYNSAQVEVSRDLARNVSFRASYTYGKALDDASEIFSTFSNPNTTYGANLQRLAQEYSNSSFDRRHIASFEYIFTPQGFRSDNLLANGLLEVFTRHFIISGTTQFSSGPYSSYQIVGLDINNDLNPYNDRPLVGNPSAADTTVGIDGSWVGGAKGTYYDLAANNQTNALNVVTPSQVRFLIPGKSPNFVTQEVGRNSFENPGQSFWNVAAEKDIPAGFRWFEQGRFVIRAECQNVGNHNNVSVLDTNLMDVGTSFYMNKSNARESTNQSLRFWAKYQF